MSLAARSKTQVYGRLISRIAVSNRAKGVDVRLLSLLCVTRPLRRADYSFRGALLAACVCACVSNCV
jgi:hypothetical protein